MENLQNDNPMTTMRTENERKEILIHKILSSYEIHEISRLYHHLIKVTKNHGMNLNQEQYDTARITLAKLEQRVANIGSLCIRPESENELHRIVVSRDDLIFF